MKTAKNKRQTAAIHPTDSLARALSKAKSEVEQLKIVNEEKRKLLDEAEKLNARTSLLEPAPEENGEVLELSDFERTFQDMADAAEGKIVILKRNEESTRFETIGTFEIEGWGRTLDTMAKRYGGGEFRVKLMDADGHYIKGGSATLVYSKAAFPDPKVAAGGAAPGGAGLDFLSFMKESAAQQEKSLDRTVAMMRGMFESIVALMNKGDGRSGLVQSVQDLQALQQMSGSAPMKPSDVLELFAMMKELSGGGESGGGSERGFLETLALELVKKSGGVNPTALMSQLKNAARPPLPPPPAPPVPSVSAPQVPVNIPAPAATTPTPAAPEPPPAPKSLFPFHGPIVDRYIPAYAEMAINRVDPATVAQTIYDRLPDDYCMLAFDFAESPDASQVIATLGEPFASSQDWVKQVLEQLSRIKTEEEWPGKKAEEPAHVNGSPAPTPAETFGAQLVRKPEAAVA